MPPASVTSRLAAAAAPGFVLERSEAVPALIGRHQDFQFIAGLGGTACDVGAVTGDSAHVYSLGGAMGAACMIGLGLALARPDKRVLVVTGDGELLMNIGALADHRRDRTRRTSRSSASTTATTARPAGRRAIPASASTSRRSRSAPASSAPHTVAVDADIAAGARLLREGNGTAFVLLRVKPTEPAAFKRNFDASLLRDRFRAALQSKQCPG